MLVVDVNFNLLLLMSLGVVRLVVSLSSSCRIWNKQRLTIPLRVREVLGLVNGDYVRMAVVEVVRPRSRVEEPKGLG